MWVRKKTPKRGLGGGVVQVYKLHGSEHSSSKALSPQPPNVRTLELFCFSSSVLGSLERRHLTQICHHQSFTQEVCTRDFKWQSIWWRDHRDQWNRVCVCVCVCVFCDLNLQQEMATAVAMCAMQSPSSSVVVGAHSMTTPPQGSASTTPVSVAGPFRTQVNIFTLGGFFFGGCMW